MPLKLALLGQTCLDNQATLKEHLKSDWQIGHWLPGDSPEAGSALMADADALVVGGDALISGGAFALIPKAKKLRLFQIPFAGYDWLRPEGVPESCLVCNALGHEIPMAEFAMASLLEWEIGLRRIDPDFRAGSWAYQGTSLSPDSKHGEVHGKTLGIYGYGQIGREAAHRASAFGMRVIAIARRPRETPPAPLDWIGTNADLPRLLAESDYLLLACDLNDQTRHIINDTALSQMKSDAIIINVARGPVIEEEALYDALKSKRIAGAVIDTWYIYPGRPLPAGTPEASPRPSRFAFHELDNLIMTPHCSAHTDGADRRRWTSIAANLDAFAQGQRPANVVMTGTARKLASA